MKYLAKNISLCFALFIWLNNFGQCPTHESFIKETKNLDDNKYIDGKTKLNKYYLLKKSAETCGFTQDSFYVTILIKIGTNEFWENENYNLAVYYTLDALRINHALKSAASFVLTANAYDYLGYYYFSINSYQMALDYYDSLIVFNKRLNHSVLQARQNKVAVYYLLDDQQKCVDESKLGIKEAVADRDTLFYISFLNSKALSLYHLNILPEALADVQVETKLAQLNNISYRLADAYLVNALICEKEKLYDSAISFFDKVITVRRKAYNHTQLGSNDYNNIVTALADDYNYTGNFYLNSLHKYSKAIYCYNHAVLFIKKINNPLPLAYSYAQINVSTGESNFKQHKLQQAIKDFKQALSYLNINVTDFVNQNPSAKQVDLLTYKDVVFEIMSNKVELLLTLFNQSKQSNYLNACFSTCKLIDSLLTQIRHEQTGEQSKLYWRNKTRDFYANAIEACYLNNNPEQAFFFMERSRAVLLSDKLNELGAASQLPPLQAGKEKNLRNKIVEAQQKLAVLNPTSKEYAIQDSINLAAKDEQDKFIKLLERNHPVYYQYKYADSVPLLQTLQQFLAKNHQSFIHYFMNDTVMYALGISANKTTFIKLTAKDFDSRQLAEFLNLCRDKFALNSRNNVYAALAQNIYKKIVAPLHLPGGNVAVCTDNFLIPFEALCADSVGKDFLLYHYNFSYVYSARSLMKPFAGNAASRNFIGFAPVTFAQNLQVTPLNQSAKALSKSADFYNNAILFTDKKATRNSFFSNASNYAVINIFSHAQADTSEQEPRLYMQDSVIYLSELQLLKNPSAQFVLLSACQTNIGKTATGEGIYSLARGFALAGIPAVSATLWNADEQTVYAISGKFNEYLAAGMNKSEALQKAKIWFIEKNKNSGLTLPYYWANMVLIGSSQPIVLAKENYTWQWLAGAAFVLLLITSAVLLQRRRNLRFFNS